MSRIKSTFAICLLSGVSLLTGTISALAADLLPPPPPPPIEIRQSSYDWSGVYIGAFIGVGSSDNDYLPIGAADPEISGSGILGGVMAGYNYQMEDFVVGAEADFTYTDIHARNTADGVDQRIPYFGTIRARLGWAHDNTMFYGTAGVAFLRSKFHIEPADETRSKTHVGFVLGGGMEHAVTDNILVRAEYLYAHFGTKDYEYTPGTVRTGVDNLHIARAGVAYKF